MTITFHNGERVSDLTTTTVSGFASAPGISRLQAHTDITLTEAESIELQRHLDHPTAFPTVEPRAVRLIAKPDWW